MKILKLTLNKAAFEVMVTGEKRKEFRKPSNWINARLFEKEKTLFEGIFKPREYNYVQFTNGYGDDKPMFIAEYKGLELGGEYELKYSNRLEVNVTKETVIIKLGAIIEVKNYDIEMKAPFARGTEFMGWQEENCLICPVYENKSTDIKMAKCKYAFQLDLASVSDGIVPEHCINGIGKDYETKGCNILNKCEFKTTLKK